MPEPGATRPCPLCGGTMKLAEKAFGPGADQVWVCYPCRDGKRAVIPVPAPAGVLTTFAVGDLDYPHRVGDAKCDEGWCGNSYPRPHEGCEAGPNGLVHADFGDENGDGDYWLYTKCDGCGEAE